MFRAEFPFTFVQFTILPCVYALPVGLIHCEIAMILISIGVDLKAVAITFVFCPFALIEPLSTRIKYDTIAMTFSPIINLSFIYGVFVLFNRERRCTFDVIVVKFLRDHPMILNAI